MENNVITRVDNIADKLVSLFIYWKIIFKTSDTG